jgi:hypothetical protein
VDHQARKLVIGQTCRGWERLFENVNIGCGRFASFVPRDQHAQPRDVSNRELIPKASSAGTGDGFGCAREIAGFVGGIRH